MSSVRSQNGSRIAIGACFSIVGAALVLTVSGCGNEGASGRSDAGTSQTPTASDSRLAPTPAPARSGRVIRFRATDGVPLRGSLVPGSGTRSPAVMLVHESNGGPGQFDGFVPYLHERGYAALTYRSRSLPGRLDEVENAQDIAGAVRALRRRADIDPERIAVLGASIGATSAAYFAFSSAGRRTRGVVGLSPGAFLDDAPAGRPRDVLLLADEAELPAAKFIAAESPGIEARLAPIDGHGVALLEDGRVRADVLEWLTERLDS